MHAARPHVQQCEPGLRARPTTAAGGVATKRGTVHEPPHPVLGASAWSPKPSVTR